MLSPIFDALEGWAAGGFSNVLACWRPVCVSGFFAQFVMSERNRRIVLCVCIYVIGAHNFHIHSSQTLYCHFLTQQKNNHTCCLFDHLAAYYLVHLVLTYKPTQIVEYTLTHQQIRLILTHWPPTMTNTTTHNVTHHRNEQIHSIMNARLPSAGRNRWHSAKRLWEMARFLNVKYGHYIVTKCLPRTQHSTAGTISGFVSLRRIVARVCVDFAIR